MCLKGPVKVKKVKEERSNYFSESKRHAILLFGDRLINRERETVSLCDVQEWFDSERIPIEEKRSEPVDKKSQTHTESTGRQQLSLLLNTIGLRGCGAPNKTARSMVAS